MGARPPTPGDPHLRRVNRAYRGCGTRGHHSPDTTLQTEKTLLVKAESSLEEAAKQTLDDLSEPRQEAAPSA